MSALAFDALPATPGSYRWYYADVSAGDTTAVAIFMLGAPFSARYAARHARGAHPLEHCAVNFALYHRGERRSWVLSEYGRAAHQKERLEIGNSSLGFASDGSIRLRVDERTAPWGRPLRAEMVLQPEFEGLGPQRLVEGEPHFWQPLVPRARATLEVEGAAGTLEGTGYFDSNWGAEPLGKTLEGWQWTRIHHRAQTEIWYRPPRGNPLHVRAGATGAHLSREAAASPPLGTTRWGLRVPRTLPLEGASHAAAQLLESSPFYARLEAKGEGSHTLSEVADFRRFHSPMIRWMAHFRTRVEASP